ncbi:hypothetical protein [Acinetobacter sp. MD2]|uniref:hypothetical protein n=1 Tax=Acinetobacter sp. MD2 TaxID=2600066 RepID=UPI002D1EEEC9|nr:hypothetical protein [Acinetobacter sp. MD2]MEB3767173.1 hypothetical protein [Acinetobacter sp. MD2]
MQKKEHITSLNTADHQIKAAPQAIKTTAPTQKTITTTAPPTIEITPNLSTWVWRDWISEDGSLFLTLRTGVWNPNGTLFYLDRRGGVSLEGFQKGLNIQLKSFDAEKGLEAPPEYKITGTLNREQNTFNASIIHYPDETERQMLFKPAIATSKTQPVFKLKYYGFEDPEWHNKKITQVTIINPKNQTIQRLTGFEAQAYSVEYLDLNYDGYFDILLDVSKQVGNGEQRYLAFTYNPETEKFEKYDFINNTLGDLTRYPQKKQLHLEQGLFEMQNGQWKEIPCCYAD